MMEIHSKYYGRKTARTLTAESKKLYEEFFPLLPFNSTGDSLEIGFGMGDFLAHQALLYPDRQFIGVEPFKTGIVSLLKKIQKHGITNIRIHHGVIHEILDQLPLLSKIYILYPDPWPKKKHHKRRLIQKDFLIQLSKHLKPGGTMYIVSDHADYQAWIKSVLQDTRDIIFSVSDTPFDEWIETKYEKRAKQEGRIPQYYEVHR